MVGAGVVIAKFRPLFKSLLSALSRGHDEKLKTGFTLAFFCLFLSFFKNFLLFIPGLFFFLFLLGNGPLDEFGGERGGDKRGGGSEGKTLGCWGGVWEIDGEGDGGFVSWDKV